MFPEEGFVQLVYTSPNCVHGLFIIATHTQDRFDPCHLLQEGDVRRNP
jgi:hypothetical protein